MNDRNATGMLGGAKTAGKRDRPRHKERLSLLWIFYMFNAA